MNCRDTRPLLPLFFDGQLDPRQMRGVALHSTRCLECKRSSWRNSPSHSRQRVLCSATPRIWRGSSWPSKNSGRSGRVSRQFIDALAARRHRRCRSRFPARSGSQAIPQLVLELLPRVVQAAHDGAFGALHDTADIVV